MYLSTGKFVKCSTLPPGCGHCTSRESIFVRLPTPSNTRGSCDERKLPPPVFMRVRVRSPDLYVSRAPTASRLDFVPTSCTPSQWFCLPTLFRRKIGAPSLTATSTSMPPSLLKSPTAIPRAEKDFPNTGPLWLLTFLYLPPE